MLRKKTFILSDESEKMQLETLLAQAVEALNKEFDQELKQLDKEELDAGSLNQKELDRLKGEIDAEVGVVTKFFKDKKIEAVSTLIESEGLIQEFPVDSWEVNFDDSSKATILAPHSGANANYLDFPGGYFHGGSAFKDENFTAALDEAYDTSTARGKKERAAAEHGLNILGRHEGGAGSLNTWDNAIVSLGSGIAGNGPLQKVFWRYKMKAPADFFEMVGRYGIDIRKDRQNAYFTVKVPSKTELRSDEFLDTYSNGAEIKGSDKSSRPCPALKFIASDPILSARFRYVTLHSDEMQKALIGRAVDSIKKGQNYDFVVPKADGTEIHVDWNEVVGPLGDEYLAATQAVIAYKYHGSPDFYGRYNSKKKGKGLRGLMQDAYMDIAGEKQPADLSSEERLKMAKAMTRLLKKKKINTYRKEFPGVADELFPLPSSK